MPLMDRCLDSWRKVMPDYEIAGILLDNADKSSRYVQEALEAGKWVIASVYLRFKYLHDHSGIYLDTDVVILKRFDLLLKNTYF